MGEMPCVIETKNTDADQDPVIAIDIEIVIDVAAQDPDPGQEIAIGTKDVIVHVPETDVVQDLVIAHTEEGQEAVVVAIVIEIEIAVQETNDHKTIVIFHQRYQPTSRPRS